MLWQVHERELLPCDHLTGAGEGSAKRFIGVDYPRMAHSNSPKGISRLSGILDRFVNRLQRSGENQIPAILHSGLRLVPEDPSARNTRFFLLKVDQFLPASLASKSERGCLDLDAGPL